MDFKKIKQFYTHVYHPTANKFLLERFNKTNLYAVRMENGDYGLLLSDIYSKTKFEYKNIKLISKPKIHDENTKIILKNCYLILLDQSINKEIFFKILKDFLLNVKTKNIINLLDIKRLLIELEKITKREQTKKQEIIGVWGELFFINELIQEKSSKYIKDSIINAWESENSRTLIDFNFINSQTVIEVKSTTKNKRFHHIYNFDQVSEKNDHDCYLLSICLNEDKKGSTCKELIASINKNLDSELSIKFKNRMELRGQACLDNKIFLSINNELPFKLFGFDVIPKPKFDENIYNINWDISLDNIKPLSSLEQSSVINKIKNLD